MTRKSTKQNPTMRDVADSAGVSPSTVSLVLSGRKNGASRISQETKQRIYDAVRKLNYVPSQVARHLRRQSTERICVVLPSFGLPYDNLLIRDVREAAEQRGYSVVVNVSENVEQMANVLMQIRAGLADGLLLSLGLEHASQDKLGEHLQLLAASGIPAVVLSNHYKSQQHDTVTNTEESTCYEAVRYLIEGGHKRIAFIGHTLDVPHYYLRYGSYLKALRDADLPVDPQLMRVGASTPKEAHQSIQALLDLAERPTAVFCGSDIAAVSALSAIHAAGLRVPGDIAVIGTGNIPEGEFSYPPLTTVGPSERDFGPIARLLFERLQGKGPMPARTLEQKWALVRRASA